ncbi:MAG: PorV/PorQ family protein, partial [Flexibacteraceae bacterium]
MLFKLNNTNISPMAVLLLGKGASSNIFAVERSIALRSMTNKIKGFCLLSLAMLGSVAVSNAQTSTSGSVERNKTIITAVPFLTITPDARAGGMGDAGVATDPDANSAFWNPGKLAFNTQKFGMAVNYTPWLRNIGVNDIFLSHISGFYKFRKEDALAVSLTYFNLGSIQFTDEQN